MISFWFHSICNIITITWTLIIITQLSSVRCEASNNTNNSTVDGKSLVVGKASNDKQGQGNASTFVARDCPNLVCDQPEIADNCIMMSNPSETLDPNGVFYTLDDECCPVYWCYPQNDSKYIGMFGSHKKPTKRVKTIYATNTQTVNVTKSVNAPKYPSDAKTFTAICNGTTCKPKPEGSCTEQDSTTVSATSIYGPRRICCPVWVCKFQNRTTTFHYGIILPPGVSVIRPSSTSNTTASNLTSPALRNETCSEIKCWGGKPSKNCRHKSSPKLQAELSLSINCCPLWFCLFPSDAYNVYTHQGMVRKYLVTRFANETVEMSSVAKNYVEDGNNDLDLDPKYSHKFLSLTRTNSTICPGVECLPPQSNLNCLEIDNPSEEGVKTLGLQNPICCPIFVCTGNKYQHIVLFGMYVRHLDSFEQKPYIPDSFMVSSVRPPTNSDLRQSYTSDGEASLWATTPSTNKDFNGDINDERTGLLAIDGISTTTESQGLGSKIKENAKHAQIVLAHDDPSVFSSAHLGHPNVIVVTLKPKAATATEASPYEAFKYRESQIEAASNRFTTTIRPSQDPNLEDDDSNPNVKLIDSVSPFLYCKNVKCYSMPDPKCMVQPQRMTDCDMKPLLGSSVDCCPAYKCPNGTGFLTTIAMTDGVSDLAVSVPFNQFPEECSVDSEEATTSNTSYRIVRIYDMRYDTVAIAIPTRYVQNCDNVQCSVPNEVTSGLCGVLPTGTVPRELKKYGVSETCCSIWKCYGYGVKTWLEYGFATENMTSNIPFLYKGSKASYLPTSIVIQEIENLVGTSSCKGVVCATPLKNAKCEVADPKVINSTQVYLRYKRMCCPIWKCLKRDGTSMLIYGLSSFQTYLVTGQRSILEGASYSHSRTEHTTQTYGQEEKHQFYRRTSSLSTPRSASTDLNYADQQNSKVITSQKKVVQDDPGLQSASKTYVAEQKQTQTGSSRNTESKMRSSGSKGGVGTTIYGKGSPRKNISTSLKSTSQKASGKTSAQGNTSSRSRNRVAADKAATSKGSTKISLRNSKMTGLKSTSQTNQSSSSFNSSRNDREIDFEGSSAMYNASDSRTNDNAGLNNSSFPDGTDNSGLATKTNDSDSEGSVAEEPDGSAKDGKSSHRGQNTDGSNGDGTISTVNQNQNDEKSQSSPLSTKYGGENTVESSGDMSTYDGRPNTDTLSSDITSDSRNETAEINSSTPTSDGSSLNRATKNEEEYNGDTSSKDQKVNRTVVTEDQISENVGRYSVESGNRTSINISGQTTDILDPSTNNVADGSDLSTDDTGQTADGSEIRIPTHDENQPIHESDIATNDAGKTKDSSDQGIQTNYGTQTTHRSNISTDERRAAYMSTYVTQTNDGNQTSTGSKIYTGHGGTTTDMSPHLEQESDVNQTSTGSKIYSYQGGNAVDISSHGGQASDGSQTSTTSYIYSSPGGKTADMSSPGGDASDGDQSSTGSKIITAQREAEDKFSQGRQAGDGKNTPSRSNLYADQTGKAADMSSHGKQINEGNQTSTGSDIYTARAETATGMSTSDNRNETVDINSSTPTSEGSSQNRVSKNEEKYNGDTSSKDQKINLTKVTEDHIAEHFGSYSVESENRTSINKGGQTADILDPSTNNVTDGSDLSTDDTGQTADGSKIRISTHDENQPIYESDIPTNDARKTKNSSDQGIQTNYGTQTTHRSNISTDERIAAYMSTYVTPTNDGNQTSTGSKIYTGHGGTTTDMPPHLEQESDVNQTSTASNIYTYQGGNAVDILSHGGQASDGSQMSTASNIYTTPGGKTADMSSPDGETSDGDQSSPGSKIITAKGGEAADKFSQGRGASDGNQSPSGSNLHANQGGKAADMSSHGNQISEGNQTSNASNIYTDQVENAKGMSTYAPQTTEGIQPSSGSNVYPGQGGNADMSHGAQSTDANQTSSGSNVNNNRGSKTDHMSAHGGQGSDGSQTTSTTPNIHSTPGGKTADMSFPGGEASDGDQSSTGSKRITAQRGEAANKFSQEQGTSDGNQSPSGSNFHANQGENAAKMPQKAQTRDGKPTATVSSMSTDQDGKDANNSSYRIETNDGNQASTGSSISTADAGKIADISNQGIQPNQRNQSTHLSRISTDDEETTSDTSPQLIPIYDGNQSTPGSNYSRNDAGKTADNLDQSMQTSGGNQTRHESHRSRDEAVKTTDISAQSMKAFNINQTTNRSDISRDDAGTTEYTSVQNAQTFHQTAVASDESDGDTDTGSESSADGEDANTVTIFETVKRRKIKFFDSENSHGTQRNDGNQTSTESNVYPAQGGKPDHMSSHRGQASGVNQTSSGSNISTAQGEAAKNMSSGGEASDGDQSSTGSKIYTAQGRQAADKFSQSRQGSDGNKTSTESTTYTSQGGKTDDMSSHGGQASEGNPASTGSIRYTSTDGKTADMSSNGGEASDGDQSSTGSKIYTNHGGEASDKLSQGRQASNGNQPPSGSNLNADQGGEALDMLSRGEQRSDGNQSSSGSKMPSDESDGDIDTGSESSAYGEDANTVTSFETVRRRKIKFIDSENSHGTQRNDGDPTSSGSNNSTPAGRKTTNSSETRMTTNNKQSLDGLDQSIPTNGGFVQLATNNSGVTSTNGKANDAFNGQPDPAETEMQTPVTEPSRTEQPDDGGNENRDDSGVTTESSTDGKEVKEGTVIETVRRRKIVFTALKGPASSTPRSASELSKDTSLADPGRQHEAESNSFLGNKGRDNQPNPTVSPTKELFNPNGRNSTNNVERNRNVPRAHVSSNDGEINKSETTTEVYLSNAGTRASNLNSIKTSKGEPHETVTRRTAKLVNPQPEQIAQQGSQSPSASNSTPSITTLNLGKSKLRKYNDSANHSNTNDNPVIMQQQQQYQSQTSSSSNASKTQERMKVIHKNSKSGDSNEPFMQIEEDNTKTRTSQKENISQTYNQYEVVPNADYGNESYPSQDSNDQVKPVNRGNAGMRTQQSSYKHENQSQMYDEERKEMKVNGNGDNQFNDHNVQGTQTKPKTMWMHKSSKKEQMSQKYNSDEFKKTYFSTDDGQSQDPNGQGMKNQHGNTRQKTQHMSSQKEQMSQKYNSDEFTKTYFSNDDGQSQDPNDQGMSRQQGNTGLQNQERRSKQLQMSQQDNQDEGSQKTYATAEGQFEMQRGSEETRMSQSQSESRSQYEDPNEEFIRMQQANTKQQVEQRRYNQMQTSRQNLNMQRGLIAEDEDPYQQVIRMQQQNEQENARMQNEQEMQMYQQNMDMQQNPGPMRQEEWQQ